MVGQSISKPVQGTSDQGPITLEFLDDQAMPSTGKLHQCQEILMI